MASISSMKMIQGRFSAPAQETAMFRSDRMNPLADHIGSRDGAEGRPSPRRDTFATVALPCREGPSSSSPVGGRRRIASPTGSSITDWSC